MSLNCSLSGMSANSTSRRCMLRCKELLAVAVHVYRYNHFWTYTLSLPTLSLIGAVSQESSWCMLLDLVTLSPHENDERLKSKVQNYFCVIITGNIRWGGGMCFLTHGQLAAGQEQAVFEWSDHTNVYALKRKCASSHTWVHGSV